MHTLIHSNRDLPSEVHKTVSCEKENQDYVTPNTVQTTVN